MNIVGGTELKFWCEISLNQSN